MADKAQGEAARGMVSEAEQRARVDCAALYRLVALHEWDDLVFTHISVRVPGPEAHFLINPYGMLFEEITASSLVKVDLGGALVSETPHCINPAGFTIHSAVHAARPDAHCVIHMHGEAGVSVSAQKEGLLPLTQNALLALPHLAYHDYEGVALELSERERLVRDLGDKSLMLLRNHGSLALGPSAAQAFIGLYILERACRQQIMALSAGRSGVLEASSDAQAIVRTQSAILGYVDFIWPALLRRLDRRLPGYDS